MIEKLPQSHEKEGQILIAVIDETYGATEEEAWNLEREKYRQGLEAEFGLPFADANIGPSVDLPAFVTVLQGTAIVPFWLLVTATFFLGKPLHENLRAWRDMAVKLRSFFKRPIYLSRHGTAVLAVEAVLDKMGDLPKTIRLIGYRTVHIGEAEELAALPRDNDIGEAPSILFLGFIRHIFEIEADGALFRISVEGKETKILRLD